MSRRESFADKSIRLAVIRSSRGTQCRCFSELFINKRVARRVGWRVAQKSLHVWIILDVILELCLAFDSNTFCWLFVIRSHVSVRGSFMIVATRQLTGRGMEIIMSGIINSLKLIRLAVKRLTYYRCVIEFDLFRLMGPRCGAVSERA